MRREGLSLTAAARKAHTTPATVRRYGAAALARGPAGRYRVKKRDSLYRRLRVVTTQGRIELEVDSEEASLVSRHANAVRKYGYTGDTNALVHFRGVRVAGHELESDPDALDRLDREGELGYLDLYDTTA